MLQAGLLGSSSWLHSMHFSRPWSSRKACKHKLSCPQSSALPHPNYGLSKSARGFLIFVFCPEKLIYQSDADQWFPPTIFGSSTKFHWLLSQNTFFAIFILQTICVNQARACFIPPTSAASQNFIYLFPTWLNQSPPIALWLNKYINTFWADRPALWKPDALSLLSQAQMDIRICPHQKEADQKTHLPIRLGLRQGPMSLRALPNQPPDSWDIPG